MDRRRPADVGAGAGATAASASTHCWTRARPAAPSRGNGPRSWSGCVADLYGAGIERILDILFDAGRLDDAVLAALAADDLVASLLLVHGLHPYGVASGSSGRWRAYGPTSAPTAETWSCWSHRRRASYGCGCWAVATAARPPRSPSPSRSRARSRRRPPRWSASRWRSRRREAGRPGVIPVAALRSPARRRRRPAGAWEPVPGLDGLAPGAVSTVAVGELDPPGRPAR